MWYLTTLRTFSLWEGACLIKSYMSYRLFCFIYQILLRCKAEIHFIWKYLRFRWGKYRKSAFVDIGRGSFPNEKHAKFFTFNNKLPPQEFSTSHSRARFIHPHNHELFFVNTNVFDNLLSLPTEGSCSPSSPDREWNSRCSMYPYDHDKVIHYRVPMFILSQTRINGLDLAMHSG